MEEHSSNLEDVRKRVDDWNIAYMVDHLRIVELLDKNKDVAKLTIIINDVEVIAYVTLIF